MATQSSVLARRIPWAEEPGKLWSMESQRVGHDLAAKQQEQEQRVNTLLGVASAGHTHTVLL